MLRIDNILLALDYTASSERATSLALLLAERTGAKLHMLYADVLQNDPERAEQVAAAPDRLRERIRDSLEPDSQIRFDPGSVQVEHVTVRGVAAAAAILSYAEDQDVDLIVMGTHGRRGVQRLLLGSVAEEVVRLAPSPVLTVGSAGSKRLEPSRRPILVPVDFSDHARAALLHAEALAELLDVHVEVLHVVEQNLYPLIYGHTLQTAYEVDPELDQRASEALERFVSESWTSQVDVQTFVQSGHAYQEVLAFAKEREAGMILMSTHGVTGLEHFLVGSVAEKVVRRATCPVFTLKSFGKHLLSSDSSADPSTEASAEQRGPVV